MDLKSRKIFPDTSFITIGSYTTSLFFYASTQKPVSKGQGGSLLLCDIGLRFFMTHHKSSFHYYHHRPCMRSCMYVFRSQLGSSTDSLEQAFSHSAFTKLKSRSEIYLWLPLVLSSVLRWSRAGILLSREILRYRPLENIYIRQFG